MFLKEQSDGYKLTNMVIRLAKATYMIDFWMSPQNL
jgi:hypothetical protein